MKIEEFEKMKKVYDLVKECNADKIEIVDYSDYVGIEFRFNKNDN